MKCPICKAEFNSKPLKEWVYASRVVSRFKCPQCRENFNLYEQEGGKIYTIPKEV